jgi:N-acyl-D-aspartate/D-glutamate deacylase
VLDLVIRGGSVLDGTGAPARRVDVGVADGRIVVVGDAIADGAARTIDADGLTLAPGFVDVHTHYDAQVFWDGACTPSCLHGVTTVFGGNCGFSIAPLGDDPAYLVRLLARVEGIPLAALEAGVPWSWRTFGEYLGAVASAGVAVNFGALVGHSAVRRAVLGERSGDAAVTESELAAMRALVRSSLQEGAHGFSSSWAATHLDGEGDPVPSRAAAPAELVALCGELAAFPGSQVEFIPTNGPFEERHVELMADMAAAARATLNWNVLIPRDRALTEGRLAASDRARERGARVLALSYPDVIRSRVSFLSAAFDAIPGWGRVMALAPEAKLAALADPERRAQLRAGAVEGAAQGLPTARLETLTIGETHHPDHAGYTGRRVGDVAAELGRDPLDQVCDLVVADGLRTTFVPEPPGSDGEAWELRRRTWTDDRVVIGASDGGAHLDILTTFDYPVRYLALAREHDELTLPEAVRQLTDVPARLYGLADRGRIEPGRWADLVLFDPESVGAGPVEWRTDLPAGAGRLHAEPTGIARVIVNGTEIVADGRLTGATPGSVLRLGSPAGSPAGA